MPQAGHRLYRSFPHALPCPDARTHPLTDPTPRGTPEGPPFVKVSARVTTHSAADIEAWLRSRRVDPGGQRCEQC